MITIRLPDGSTRQLEDGATALSLAQSIGPRLAKAAVAATVDGETVDLGTRLPDGAEVAVITEDSDAGRAVLRHSTAHVLAQAVLALWPGAHYAIGPAIAEGFYYDFELPGGATFSDDDLERIEEKMRAMMDADQRFVREEHSVEEGLALFADQPFKREIIEGVSGAAARRRAVGRGVGRHRPRCRRGEHLPQRRRLRRTGLRRPVPRSARALDGPARALQAPARRRRVLARRRAPAPAAAHLRHRLGVREGLGRAPPSPGGGRAPRPPASRRGARPVLVPHRDRLGSGRVPSQGGDHPPPHGGLLAPAPHRRRLPIRLHAAHHQGRAVRDLGTSRLVRRGHVPPHGARGGAEVLPQAHELPVPHSRVPEPAALVSRASHAPVRVRHRLPLREVGGGARPDPGAGHDPGRRPHLLHPGADGRGAHRSLLAIRARPAARLRARGLLPRAVHQAAGQGGGQRRGMGGRHRGAAGRGRAGETSSS